MQRLKCPYCGGKIYSASWQEGKETCIYCEREFIVKWDKEKKEYVSGKRKNKEERNKMRKCFILLGLIFAFGSLGHCVVAEEVIDFYRMREKAKASTKAQFNEWKKGLVGKQVSWEGWIDEVKEKFFGGYTVKIDMDPPESLSVYDISIDFPAEKKGLVLSLQKDSKVFFSGKIKSIYFILGSLTIYLEDVTFGELDYKIQIEQLEKEKAKLEAKIKEIDQRIDELNRLIREERKNSKIEARISIVRS